MLADALSREHLKSRYSDIVNGNDALCSAVRV